MTKPKTPSVPPQPALGLVCPHCACRHFRVIYLQRRPNGVLMRRRECRHCGRRITTREHI